MMQIKLVEKEVPNGTRKEVANATRGMEKLHKTSRSKESAERHPIRQRVQQAGALLHDYAELWRRA